MGSRVWFMSRATGRLTYGVNEKREREPKSTGNKPPLGMIWFCPYCGGMGDWIRCFLSRVMTF